MICMAMMLTTSVLFYCRAMGIVFLLSVLAGLITFCTVIKYVVTFGPKLLAKSGARTQLLIFRGSYLFLGVLYWYDWISTVELMFSGVYISWDWNGQIVTHDVLKEELPIFTPHYWLTVGVIFEYYYFNPLVWMVDSKNNIHLTTLGLWLYLGYKNWSHFLLMANKLTVKGKEKKKKHKNGMTHSKEM